jgi:hypothetical protein
LVLFGFPWIYLAEFYLLEKGFFPARKVGGSWQSTEGEVMPHP